MPQETYTAATFLRNFLAEYHRSIPTCTDDELRGRLCVYFEAREELGDCLEARGLPRDLLYRRGREDLMSALDLALDKGGEADTLERGV